MKFFARAIGLSAVAALLAGSSVAVAANPAAALSLSGAPTLAAAQSEGATSGNTTSTYINIGILAVLTAGVLLLTTSGGDDSPNSP